MLVNQTEQDIKDVILASGNTSHCLLTCYWSVHDGNNQWLLTSIAHVRRGWSSNWDKTQRVLDVIISLFPRRLMETWLIWTWESWTSPPMSSSWMKWTVRHHSSFTSLIFWSDDKRGIVLLCWPGEISMSAAPPTVQTDQQHSQILWTGF